MIFFTESVLKCDQNVPKCGSGLGTNLTATPAATLRVPQPPKRRQRFWWLCFSYCYVQMGSPWEHIPADVVGEVME
jgi:hypothetical protein